MRECYQFVLSCCDSRWFWCVLVNNQPSLEKTAGVPGETFKFLYTAIGTQAENPNSLDGGELQLEIPRGWPTPTSANIVVNGDPDGGDEGTTPPATVGTFRITGSGPWFITVPITAMGGTEEIQIEYKGVTVPFGTGTYHFPVGVKEFGGRLTQVASVSITVSVAGAWKRDYDCQRWSCRCDQYRESIDFCLQGGGHVGRWCA